MCRRNACALASLLKASRDQKEEEKSILNRGCVQKRGISWFSGERLSRCSSTLPGLAVATFAATCARLSDCIFHVSSDRPVATRRDGPRNSIDKLHCGHYRRRNKGTKVERRVTFHTASINTRIATADINYQVVCIYIYTLLEA